MTRIIVVGGGVGGLSAAIRLAAAGNDVTLLERNERVGGKLTTFERDGFSFDVGPSLLTLPDVLDETFRAAGTSLAAEVSLVRLDPQFTYSWTDGSKLTVFDDRDATADAFERYLPGAGDAWRRFDDHGRDIWEVAERTFFAGPMSIGRDMLRRLQSRRDIARIDAFRSLTAVAVDTFGHRNLAAWVGRYATYSGSFPDRVPATMACIPHLESAYGCWHVTGGLGALRDAYERVATRVGVEIVTGATVVRINATPDRVTGVTLDDGTDYDAEVVVANTDALYLYTALMPDERAMHQVARLERSMSGFALCLGVSGRTDEITHHNVWFSSDTRQEFRELAAGKLASDPTIYACVSSVTDSTQAPRDEENWFILVNTPAGAEVDSIGYRDLVLRRLAERGVELRRRVRFAARMTPADISLMTRAPGGAIYGPSSNGWRAAFARPANRGTKRGLYLVGGTTHPGGGLPLVSMSARIVADMVTDDLAG